MFSCTKDRAFEPIVSVNPNNPNPLPSVKKLVINELMATNATTYQNPQQQGAYPDWFEIYNPNSFAVDMAGMYVTDNLSNFTTFRIPGGSPATIIPAYGYKVFCADDSTRQGPLHVAFKLSSSGESLGLADTSGIPIDSVSFGAQTPDVSFGRLPNGTGPFQSITSATPGAKNQ